MLTCSCNVYPLTPHFYIYSKIGVNSGTHFFLIFALKHRLCLLVTEAVLTYTHNLCFRAKIREISQFFLKIIVFTAVKKCSILHWRACVIITKTIPCNEERLTPHFYIVKLGFKRVYIISLILL